jgi:paraquat-inducible protein B
MSEKPHTVAIGAFVMGALLIALSIALFLLGSGFGRNEKVVMVFDGSVKGLNVGAPLALRGVTVGKVTDVEVLLDTNNIDFLMVVEADLMRDNIHFRGKESDDLREELLRRGLRAQLNTQSLLTGLLYIEMDFHPGSELKLADIDSPYFQFPTVPTDLQRIARKLQDIDPSKLIDDLNNIAKDINSLVSSAEFQGLPASLTRALDSMTRLSEQLQQQVASSGPKLDTVLDEAATTVASANTELPKLSALVQSNLEVLDEAIVAFEQMMSSVDGVVSSDSETIYRLNKALREVARAGKSVQSLAVTLENEPEALIKGKSGDK